MNERIKTKLHTKLYNKFEYLAEQYASKVYNFERFGYEREDIVQELRIKISNSINTYLNKLDKFNETGRYKPIPLEYYLKTAMINRTKDFIKLLNRESVENVDKISIEDNCCDIGFYSTVHSEIDLDKCICNINGVDLFYNLEGINKIVFSLFIKGFNIVKLKKMFRKKIQDFSFIDEQVEYLKLRRKELYDHSNVSFQRFSMSEE